MKTSSRRISGKSVLRSLIVPVLVLLFIFSAGCSFVARLPGTSNQPSVAVQTEVPAPAPTPIPTPKPPPLAFSVPQNALMETYMSIALNQPVGNVTAAFGEPEAIFGQNAYEYKVVAGAAETESALVYRYKIDSVGFEFIVSALDGRILKKQVSSPGAFPKLLDDASMLAVPDGTPYSGLLAAAGVDPYLWMAFLAPNAHSDENRYEVCLWPDDDGQFVAVVQNGVVLRSEYQPEDVVLMAAAVDGVTPRVPRYLEPDPDNANSTLSKSGAFKKFEDIDIGMSESNINAKLGTPSFTAEDGDLKVLTYEYSDPGYSGGKAVYVYSVTNDASAALVMKRAEALPSGGEEILGRYAPQMLPGMSMDDVKDFMGKPLVTSMGLLEYGRPFTVYSCVGYYACVSAVFAKVNDTELCLRNEMITTDPLEAQTLYEEYVLPVRPSKSSTPAPTLSLPLFTIRPSYHIFTPKPTPKPTIPIVSFVIPSIIIITPAPTPTPSPTPVMVY